MPRNIQFKVGLFMIITSVMILSFVGYVAYKKGIFATQHTYTLSSKSGENLTEGMPVVFSGFKIGRVDALELNEDGLVLIKIKVADQHIKWIRQDSVFILEKPLTGALPDFPGDIWRYKDAGRRGLIMAGLLDQIDSLLRHIRLFLFIY